MTQSSDRKLNPPTEPAATAPQPGHESFAETALRLGGKGEDEVRRTGAVDAADEQVEALFAARYQTTSSPIHRAVWERKWPIELFQSARLPLSSDAEQAMQSSLDIVRRHRQAGTLLDSQQKISTAVFEELAAVGYWGLLVDCRYQGLGVPFSQFAPFLTQMAMLDATVASLASVHGCIGAVDPVQTFGTAEQKERLLPPLARGERLSAFALTEPGAGSDLTALRTIAVREGDEFILRGEKLFITNVVPGRTIAVVCLIDNRPAVLIVDLPETETAEFQLKKYGLYALKHTHNQGIVFDGLRVPAENLLQPPSGDGLTIAYHGLNRGRVSLCATAAGSLRMMLADLRPWVHRRRTYGAAIGTRELVQRRLGLLAGLIVGCDALTEWCGTLLDQGYRGEIECIVAKIFGSEALKFAAIELFMKTHGGRSFLHGNLFGDNVHEYLAPSIYEGEGEMLGMALFKSLVKQHGKRYFEPIGKALQEAGIRQPNLANPAHLWRLRKPMWDYGRWYMQQSLRPASVPSLPPLPDQLRHHAEFAASFLGQSALEITSALRRYQLKLADRQCRMSEISDRIQTATVILCTSLYAARQENEIIRDAANCLCNELTRRLRGTRVTDAELRQLVQLGAAVAEGNFPLPADLPVGDILMPYSDA